MDLSFINLAVKVLASIRDSVHIVGYPYKGRGTGVFGKLSPDGASYGRSDSDQRRQADLAVLIPANRGSTGRGHAMPNQQQLVCRSGVLPH
jgi:hypothetical protein